jgi:hypothetical protein
MRPAATSFRLEPELLQAANKKAESYGISVASVVKNSLREFIGSDNYTFYGVEVLDPPTRFKKRANLLAKKMHQAVIKQAINDREHGKLAKK